MAKRVLMCRVDGNFGGVEQHVLTLASHYNANRFIPVIAPISNHGILEQRAIQLGMDTAFIPMNTRSAIFSASHVLAEIVERHQIDLIHTFGIRSSTLAWMARKKINIPWVITLPNINSTDYPNPVQARLSHTWNNFLLRQADTVHVISPHLKEYISKILFPPKTVYTIINGVEMPNHLLMLDQKWIHKQYGLPEDSVMIGSTGRLEDVKGYDVLIKAFAKINRQYHNVYLMLVGDGSRRESLLQLASSLNISDYMIMTGYTQSVWEHLMSMNVYVCSSRSEGVPFSVLEAMAAGLPILSTNVGGIPGIITDQLDGILIPPNSHEAVAEAIMELLSHPDKAAVLGQNAKKKAESEFSANHMADKVQDMYDEMLERFV